jgi:hypothetical protein
LTDPVKDRLAVPMNVARLAPAGTLTEAGTLTSAAFVLDTSTISPPARAGELRVTVPVVLPPGETLPGRNLRAATMVGAVGSRRNTVPKLLAPPTNVVP